MGSTEEGVSGVVQERAKSQTATHLFTALRAAPDKVVELFFCGDDSRSCLLCLRDACQERGAGVEELQASYPLFLFPAKHARGMKLAGRTRHPRWMYALRQHSHEMMELA